MRYITLSEYLRPWAQLGITHFLPTNGDDISPIVSENLLNRTLPSESLSFTEGRGVPSIASEYTLDRAAPHPFKDKKVQDAQVTSLVTSEVSSSAEKKVYTFSALSSIWERQLAKVSKSSVVWSYPELGLDLSGKAVPERSAALKLLIGKLALPKGTSAFWPMALPDEQGNLKGDIDAYLFGLEKIAPQVVLLLGKSAVSGLSHMIKLNVPFTQQLFEGRLYILLPDLLSIHSDSSSFEKTHHYLKSVFSTFQLTSF